MVKTNERSTTVLFAKLADNPLRMAIFYGDLEKRVENLVIERM